MATNNAIDSNIPIPIVKGGTNAASMATSYGVAYFDGSKIVTVASVGTATQALTSNGPAAAPSFQNFTGGGSGIGTASLLANRTSNQTVSDGVSNIIIFDNEIFDTSNNYNTSTGYFTVPNDGFYLESTSMYLSGSNATAYEVGTSGTVSVVSSTKEVSSVTGYAGKPIIRLTYHTAGNSIAFGENSAWGTSTTTATFGDGTFMSIFLIG